MARKMKKGRSTLTIETLPSPKPDKTSDDIRIVDRASPTSHTNNPTIPITIIVIVVVVTGLKG